MPDSVFVLLLLLNIVFGGINLATMFNEYNPVRWLNGIGLGAAIVGIVFCIIGLTN
jgi:hypothetical protein